MKKILFAFMCFIVIPIIKAQNLELSTLRIGGLKYQMTIAEVNKITEKPIKKVVNEFGSECKIATYQGAEIYLEGINMYESAVENELKVYGLSTKSPKFRTKSGMGVGSTKTELISTYKDYPNFSVGQSWDSKTEKLSTTDCYFALDGLTAGTKLNFIMKNNIVVKVEIYVDEGC